MKPPGLCLPVSNNERAPRSLTPYGLCTFVRQLDLAVRCPPGRHSVTGCSPRPRYQIIQLSYNMAVLHEVNMQPSSAVQRSASAEGPVAAAQRICYGTIMVQRSRLKLVESVRHLDTHGGKYAFFAKCDSTKSGISRTVARFPPTLSLRVRRAATRNAKSAFRPTPRFPRE